MRRALVIVGSLAALSGCRADTSPAPAAIVERSRVSMGSEVHLTAWTSDEPAALAAFEAAFDEFDRLDALMSVWKEGSEVERLNHAAGEKPVPIGRDVLDVLSMARQTSEWTEGKFDVTFGVLSVTISTEKSPLALTWWRGCRSSTIGNSTSMLPKAPPS
jgi:thiamine biosynthesis lipoprotein ApbE